MRIALINNLISVKNLHRGFDDALSAPAAQGASGDARNARSLRYGVASLPLSHPGHLQKPDSHAGHSIHTTPLGLPSCRNAMNSVSKLPLMDQLRREVPSHSPAQNSPPAANLASSSDPSSQAPSPMSGTNRQAPRVCTDMSFCPRMTRISSCDPAGPTGTTSLPPGAS